MAFYEELFHLKLADDLDGIPELIADFYAHNGYLLESEDESQGRYIFVRGKSSAGWWSSNMADLHTTITLELGPTEAKLHYRVNVTGQRLLDEDRAFWRKEAQALAATVERGAEFVDLRPAEARRAEEVSKNLRSSGIWYAIAVFFALMVALFVANFLGS